MAVSNPRPRPGNAAKDGRIPAVGIAPEEEAFPPLTTSLEAFVKNRSDREFRQLIFELIGLSNQMGRHADHFARYIGTNNAQLQLILLMAQTPDLTVGQIAQVMSVSSQFVTIEIGNLIKKGIACKRPNQSDRRSSFLNLTPKGRNLVRELAPLQRRANDLQFRSLTEERARTLKEIIHTLIMDGRRVLHELESPDICNTMAPSARPHPETRNDAPRSNRRQARQRQ